MFPSRKNKGFTFVELLLAVLILSISIGGVLLLFTTSMISSQAAWDITIATSHAEHMLEEMQTRKSLTDITNTDWRKWTEEQGLNTLPSESFDVRLVETAQGLMDIRITVDWVRNLKPNNIVLNTKMSR